MPQSYITDNLPLVEQYLQDNRLRDALTLLQAMSQQAMTGAVTDAVKGVEQSYAYMLGYMSKGVEDPHRARLHSSLINDAYRLLDRLTRHTEAKDRPTLYYDALRFRARMRGQLPSLRDRVDAYVKAVDNQSLFNMAVGDSTPVSADRYMAENEIFNYIWTVYPLEGEDAEAVEFLLTDPSVPADFKSMVVSALTLGLLEFNDDRRLLLLADVYERASDVGLSMEALVGIVLSLHKYRRRPLSSKAADRLAALRDLPKWKSDLSMLQLELIRTRDTERINNKMRDEVIPQMLKIRPDILNKINDIRENADEQGAPDENPEWEKIMEDSGLRDRLKEFGELQMEGSDVMMSTFGQLKSYPFFHTVPNWFRPFSCDHPDVRSAVAGALPGAMSDLMEQAMFLCDSDKYSLVLTLAHIPESQRDMMLSQLEAQASHIAEAASSMIGTKIDRRAAVLNYLHNIYRFYKLFRRRGEFYDPFAEPINLVGVDALAGDFCEEAPLRLIAELYFRFHAYGEALDAFRRLVGYAPPSAQLFQKIGYCLERTGRYEDALETYSQAELFDARSAWTLRRLATVAKLTGKLREAAGYYARLQDIFPDDVAVAMNLGNVYAELEMYSEAIKQYYKVSFLDEHSLKPLRPLAWCLFVTGDYDASRRYFDKVLVAAPVSDDFLNRGHLALAMGDIPSAIGFYKKSVTSSDGKIDTFARKLAEDEKFLIRAGVDIKSLPMLADAVFYSL